MADISKSIIISNLPEDYNEEKIRESLSSAGEIEKILFKDGRALVVFAEEESVENSKMFDGMDDIQILEATPEDIFSFVPMMLSETTQEQPEADKKSHSSRKKSSHSSSSKKSEKSSHSLKKDSKDEGFVLVIKEKPEPEIQREATPVKEEKIEPVQEKVLENENMEREKSYEKITKAAETTEEMKDVMNMRCDINTGKCYNVSAAEKLENMNLPKGKALSDDSPLKVVFSPCFVSKVFSAWLLYFVATSLFTCCAHQH